ncbi:unnamed protein product [Larinioides sclopetarius]|uniref:SCP domain-containing protein n=1 Tax=Larinioides sclopetarius TaxID=280406 RepID=A0AAV1YRK2_9ARAC
MKIHVKLALVILCFLLATSESCKYKKFSEDHSFCKDANKNCDLKKSEVTDADKKLILKKHNEYRMKIARGKESRAGERFFVGQNIYTISSTGEAKTKNWGSLTDTFYEEVKDFDKNNIKPFKSSTDYGHFTQLAWATSWKIGCGLAVYKESGQNKSLYVCNYGPGGNINGGRMYKEGKPCSNCPSGTCCCNRCKKSGVTSDYHGLCKVLDEKNFKIDDATE